MTLNVLGLNSHKLHFITDVVSREHYDVARQWFNSCDDLIDSFSAQWQGSSYRSPSVGRQGGVVVLFSPFLMEKSSPGKEILMGV